MVYWIQISEGGPRILAKNAVAFDLRAACSGLLYSMSTARAFIKSGVYKNVLIVATDATTKYTDWEDRSVCVLFGDGAGAMILTTTEDMWLNVLFGLTAIAVIIACYFDGKRDGAIEQFKRSKKK